MLNLYCISSGSSGNSYLLSTDKRTLIIDAGLPITDIKIALNFDLLNVDGCIVTHKHNDHAKSANELKRIGIKTFLPYEQELKKPHKQQLGAFSVTALPMLDKEMHQWQHTNGDGSECPCYAFLIEVDGIRFLYVTDTKLCVWNFRKMKLTHIMIGLNYEEDMLSKEQFKTRHVITGHLGLDTCKSIVVANKTDNLQAVYLCHMGADSTDKDKCVAEIQKAAGNDVYVDCACKDKSWVLRSPDEPPF